MAGQGQAAWADPVYDAAGNMVSGPKPGQLADGATRLHFVYDAWNRLTAVWEDDGDGTLETGGQAGDDAKIAEYQYDGRNYRVVKLVAAPKSVAPAAWHRMDLYYNEGWQVLEERQARDVSPANKGVEAAAVHVQWAWDIRYIDAAVLRWRDGNLDGDLADAEDDTLYYCNDANMNVTALVDAATGAAVERYLYDPYGRVTFLNGDWTWTKTLGPDGQPNTADDGTTSNYGNEVLYCGYRFDSETGLNHVRHRYYDCTVGGWISRDPAGFLDGLNLLEYVRSNPSFYVDPSGLYGEFEHHTRILSLGQEIGIPNAKEIADANQETDDFWRSAPVQGVISVLTLGLLGRGYQDHFPGARQPDLLYLIFGDHSPRNYVRPGFRNAVVVEKLWVAIQKCDIKAFGQATHTLQDSYSHEGWPERGFHPDFFDPHIGAISNPKAPRDQWTWAAPPHQKDPVSGLDRLWVNGEGMHEVMQRGGGHHQFVLPSDPPRWDRRHRRTPDPEKRGIYAVDRRQTPEDNRRYERAEEDVRLMFAEYDKHCCVNVERGRVGLPVVGR